MKDIRTITKVGLMLVTVLLFAAPAYAQSTSAQATYSVVQIGAVYTYTLNVVNTSPAPYSIYGLLFGIGFGVPFTGCSAATTTVVPFQNLVPVSAPGGWFDQFGTCIPSWGTNFQGSAMASGYVLPGQSGTFVFTSTTPPPATVPFGTCFYNGGSIFGFCFNGNAALSGATSFQSLGGQVQSLGPPNGPLNSGQVNSLLAKLNNAVAKLNSGQVNAGCNLLSAFINEVQSLVSSGVLTGAQGDPLISQAQTISNAIPC